MGEAAEAADDVGVQLRPFQQVGIAGRAKQREAALLIGERLGMLERQVEEAAARPARSCWSKPRAIARSATARASGSAAKVRASPRNMLRGNWSSTISSASAPSAVASQSASLSGGGRLVGREEARPDVVVERRVLLEPLVRPGLAPEGEHGLGRTAITAAPRRSAMRRKAPGRAARRPAPADR